MVRPSDNETYQEDSKKLEEQIEWICKIIGVVGVIDKQYTLAAVCGALAFINLNSWRIGVIEKKLKIRVE